MSPHLYSFIYLPSTIFTSFFSAYRTCDGVWDAFTAPGLFNLFIFQTPLLLPQLSNPTFYINADLICAASIS